MTRSSFKEKVEEGDDVLRSWTIHAGLEEDHEGKLLSFLLGIDES